MIESFNISDDYLTFDELYRLNVTSHEILIWSSSIDLAEQYEYYLSQPTQSNLSNEKFFNCTQPWFGSQCQYSLEINEGVLVPKSFETALTDDIFDGTCYILLECDRGGPSICLDWREICNGRIDCLNDGIDEIECFSLEINKCNENEYRCHNGLCIPKLFLEMDSYEAQCLDRSDYLVNFFCPRFYFNFNLFECQEFICRPDEGKFSCGDGQCVEDFGQCKTNRHLLLAQSVSVQGNLSYECWISMVCLTKIMDKIENMSCNEFIQSSKIIEQLKSCKFPLQFPIIPVLYGHVRFLYHPKGIDNINVTLPLKPDYICYDEQLCDFLTPTFRHENLTCRSGDQMNLTMNAALTTWKSIIDSIKPYFDGCITQHYQIIDSYHSSLYHCKDSSKYISKYRILDGTSDCFLKDDEQALSELSCSLNQTFQFQCPNEKQCRSPLFPKSICSSPMQINYDDIPFYEICDRIKDSPVVLIGGRNHSDETDCEDWQCNNINTRCDGFRNCVNGEDEENCTQSIDIEHILFCISPHNYTMQCLPADQVSGEAVDCFRASFDDFKYLIVANITFQMYKFRCWIDTECIEDENLCNANEDCPMYDNELLCLNRSQLCYHSDFDKLLNMQDISCQVINKPYLSFSLDTALDYPSSYTTQNKSVENQIHDKMITSSLVKSSIQSEICNFGLYVYHRLGIDKYSSICFCPPNYYGDRCQYQNQRVSLTLTLATVRQPTTYIIVVMLIEDDNDRQEIHSYHQFTYIPLEHCGKFVNFYLLFSKRGKNNSKNYSIRIDAFNKDSLAYLISWHLTIPFVFLPVNRISAFLTLPISRTFNPKHCTLQCYKGTCMKYHNEERFFCQCYSGWSGAQCHIPIDCSMCPSNSICIGSIQNRSICVCPHGKFGSFCRLQLICPIGFCKNNGRCIMIDERMIDVSYRCFCSEQFFGPRCENVKHKIDISLENIETPLYLLVYIYTEISFERLPPRFVILRKMTMFQTSVAVYSEAQFQMVIVKIDNRYYLAVLRKVESSNIVTSISPAQRCVPIHELLTAQLLSLPRIQRLKSYHIPCQDHVNLQCFVDEFYMCLCTEERHSNCFPLEHQQTFACEDNVYCENGGTCLQDRRKRSRCIARWIICLLPFLILSSMIYEFINRDLFDDYEEQRVWCVVRYSKSIELYTNIVQYFHFIAPFLANLISAIFIIIYITRLKTTVQSQFSSQQQLLNQINQHKQLVISPIILAILLFSRFLISLLSTCIKSSQNPWLYLCGYFVSFIPSSFIFVIFVLPSTFYRKEFIKTITNWRQRFMRAIRAWQ
ncbi:unnamed protein product [Adineta steineri]|uniref:EGF-like domain-containing protein n=1 Tax=Adineta steineri TaxID=433720 RepID=A0A813QHS8_9BILA|nr:unnamed protein product [Adineta steineri]